MISHGKDRQRALWSRMNILVFSNASHLDGFFRRDIESCTPSYSLSRGQLYIARSISVRCAKIKSIVRSQKKNIETLIYDKLGAKIPSGKNN